MEEKEYIVFKGIRYEWICQSCVRMTWADGFIIYTDPIFLDRDPPTADIILISHHHVDHCLPEYVSPIRTDKTGVVAFHPSYIQYCARDIKRVRTVKIGQTVEVRGVRITGVEAYTERGFHMKGEGCGFLIERGGQRIYFSGDTGRTEEMDGISGIDVAIVSVADNIGAIDTEEILEAVRRMRPGLFIPIHFTPLSEPEIGEDVFSTKDPRFFTRKEDPRRFIPFFEGTGIAVAILKKLGGPS